MLNRASSKYLLPLLFIFSCNVLDAQWVRFGGILDSDLKDIHFIDEMNGVMVGRDSVDGQKGKIFRTADGGISWEVVYSDTGYSHWIEGVSFASAEKGIAVGRQNLIYHTSDAGQTWDTVSTQATPVQHETVQYVDEQTVYAANWRGEILKSTNAGLTWDILFEPFWVWGPVTSLSCPDAETCFAANSDGVLRTTNGGDDWDLVTVQQLTDIVCQDGNNCIGLLNNRGKTPTTVRTSDGGDTWIPTSLPSEYHGHCIAMAGEEGYIGGDEEAIYHTSDGGNSWKLVHHLENSDAWSRITSIFLLDADRGFACGSKGTFLRLNKTSLQEGKGQTVDHTAYPNPMQNETRFVFSEVLESATFRLFDTRGKLVSEQDIPDGSAFEYENAGLALGMYFYTVYLKKERVLSGKLLKR